MAAQYPLKKTEVKPETLERVKVVREAIIAGSRRLREIEKATGFGRHQIDRALRRLRDGEGFSYTQKTGWTPPVATRPG